MFKVTTSEIRWFIKGNIPERIETWLKKLAGEIECEPERTDIYLNIKDTSKLGIKFREGRFEVKQKMTDLGVLHSSNISGYAELWKKWSFEAVDEKIPLADITEGEWVEITKTRKLKKYIFSETGEIKEGFDNFQSNGCNLELTEMQINSSDDLKSSDESISSYWTLGLETYGYTDNLIQNLETAFEYLFKDDFPINLTKKESYSYPGWIAKCQSK